MTTSPLSPMSMIHEQTEQKAKSTTLAGLAEFVVAPSALIPLLQESSLEYREEDIDKTVWATANADRTARGCMMKQSTLCRPGQVGERQASGPLSLLLFLPDPVSLGSGVTSRLARRVTEAEVSLGG